MTPTIIIPAKASCFVIPPPPLVIPAKAGIQGFPH